MKSGGAGKLNAELDLYLAMQHEARRHDTKHEKKARHEPGTAR
jgi:hypothetical protein